MIAAERAAAPFLPQLTPRDPAEPGQFAFGDAGRVRRILAAHWQDINIEPLDVRCRSEEHTSELQSLMRISYAVFCLKKKNNETNACTPSGERSSEQPAAHHTDNKSSLSNSSNQCSTL